MAKKKENKPFDDPLNHEIMECLLNGMTHSETAEAIFRSQQCVNWRIVRMKEFFGVHRRSEFIKAYKLFLVKHNNNLINSSE